MFKALSLTLSAAAILFAGAPAFAQALVGQPAPDFESADILHDGAPFKLSEHKGETIVLEWTNHDCPFVKKHYETDNMQKTQETATKDYNVTWVSIVSSGEGRQGYVSPEEGKKIVTDTGAHPSVKLLDPSGEIGHLYGAQTTPHMFVINPEGTLVYAGAIDDQSSPNPATVEGANNYVLAALKDLAESKPVETAETKAYGCGVKYAN